MKPTLTKPNFLHLFRDYLIFQTSLSSVFGLGLGIYIYFEETVDYMAYIFIGMGLLSLLAFGLRIFWIYRLYNIGDLIEAKVEYIRFNQFNHRGMGQLKLAYEYQREQWTKMFSILKSEKTKKLSEQSTVTILVDPNHPKRICLKYLFD